MRLILVLIGAVALSGCGDDHDDDSDCDKIRDQIQTRAAGDEKLIAMGREKNPCADPIPVTSTDYRSACEQLRACLDRSVFSPAQ